MITKKTAQEIILLEEGGKKLAQILDELQRTVTPGVSTQDLNDRAMELIEELSVEPVLLGYHPEFAPHPYPAAICTSVNDRVQHGIPSAGEILQEGDIVDIDMSIGHKGMVVDSGRTIGVGKIDKGAKKLIDVTREALAVGIGEVRPGNHIGDISHAIQTYVEEQGFSVVEELCGHGVGYSVHEEPQIPNFGKAGTGPLIEAGMVFAIEPIVNEGKKDVVFDEEGDGYSVRTKDGLRSAHFEHTVVVTKKGSLVVTKH